ncbi:hypothetical protein IQ07DRAFT_593052 [Pyrenochaeta sp. DS3sAY3a]|nr:hypothetical protein IQ07DRAFT_593052 [Pyrenochaeta sp. DS3sAY3a]
MHSYLLSASPPTNKRISDVHRNKLPPSPILPNATTPSHTPIRPSYIVIPPSSDSHHACKRLRPAP